MTDSPFRILWDRLLHSLRPKHPARREFELDQELIQALRGLAEQEQRPTEDIAADLLSLALARQNASKELVQRWRSLTEREQQVSALTCLNLTNQQIAMRLHISPETVKTHVRNALFKFGLHSKAELRMLLEGWDFSAWDKLLR